MTTSWTEIKARRSRRNRARRCFQIAAALLGIAAGLKVWTLWVANWLYHPLGTCTPKPNCLGYQVWSGVISDISEITLVTGLAFAAAGWYHHHQCHGHEDGKTCRKIGIHRVDGTPFKTCWSHHPVLGQFPHHHIPIEHIHDEHKRAKNA